MKAYIWKTRRKINSPALLQNIEKLLSAIQQRKAVTFAYLHYDLRKSWSPNGRSHIMSTHISWSWKTTMCICCARAPSHPEHFAHYRVDKMGQAEVTDLPREGVEQFSQIDVTSYTNQTFGMFAGEENRYGYCL